MSSSEWTDDAVPRQPSGRVSRSHPASHRPRLMAGSRADKGQIRRALSRFRLLRQPLIQEGNDRDCSLTFATSENLFPP